MVFDASANYKVAENLVKSGQLKISQDGIVSLRDDAIDDVDVDIASRGEGNVRGEPNGSFVTLYRNDFNEWAGGMANVEKLKQQQPAAERSM